MNIPEHITYDDLIRDPALLDAVNARSRAERAPVGWCHLRAWLSRTFVAPRTRLQGGDESRAGIAPMRTSACA